MTAEPRTPRILLVDDEPSFVRALEINLRARGFTIVTARGGRDALIAYADTHPDLIILDLGLPDMDGLRVIEGLRGWADVPIIVLSARRTSDDKVEALDLGADDYVSKPFDMNELLARIRVALRRHSGTGEPAPVITAGDLEVDLGRSEVRRNGQAVRVTPTEWRFLEILARQAGTLVSHETLLREIWGPGYEHETQYLRVYMAALRRKLEADPSHPTHLVTEPGRGYRFEL